MAYHNKTRLATLSVALLIVIQLASCALQTVAESSLVMNLPDGIENILGFRPKSTFRCQRDGYFGDVDNDCRIFHLCQRQVGAQGRSVSVTVFGKTLRIKLRINKKH